MKKAMVIVSIIIAVLIAAGIMKNQIIKGAITVAVSKATGARVEIDDFSLGILTQSVKITGFRIYQPQGFPEGKLLDVPEIRVDYDIPSLLKGKIHLKILELTISEMGVIRNQEGMLNVDELTVVKQAKEEKPQKEPVSAREPKKKKSSESIDLQIDELQLSVGKVVYSIYPKEGDPSVNVFDVGIKDKVYKNISGVQQLVVLILSEPMKQTTIKGAGIYGVATVLGMGFLPVGVAATFIGKDSAAVDFSQPFDTVFEKALEAFGRLGKVTSQQKERGVIKAKVQGADVVLAISQTDQVTVHVEVSARKYLMPKPQIAGGVIHELSRLLK